MSTIRRIKNIKHWAFGQWYNLLYRYPSQKLKIIGVTGTDGKTTTSTMIYTILRHAGFKVALISTIAAKIGDRDYDTGFHVTNPTPKFLQRFLKQMVDEDIEYVILETTSHGLYQHRTAGIAFQIGVYTNITHEHLDYHHTYEEYVAAKAILIKQLKSDGRVVLNHDDRSFGYLKQYLPQAWWQPPKRIFTFGKENESDTVISKYTPSNESGSHFNLALNKEAATAMSLHLPGEYNAYNAAAAYTVARLLNVSSEKISQALAAMSNLAGRWEVIQQDPFQVVVDFAHTPNALERVLQVARKKIVKPHRVIEIFGCAGERDHKKRPLMGAVAGKYADFTIVTAEDPRHEKIETINAQIEAGLKKARKKIDRDYALITDRRAAIAKALAMAKPGDLVIITGKGHEQSMNLDGKHEVPWSDQQVAKELLANPV